jgi:hypothetical protein
LLGRLARRWCKWRKRAGHRAVNFLSLRSAVCVRRDGEKEEEKNLLQESKAEIYELSLGRKAEVR